MKKRETGYDYIRIAACFAVLMNHSISTYIFHLIEGFSISAFVADFLFNTCRMNVVSFILLSGALLLKKEESYRAWLWRILRIIIVIFLFSSIYFEWSNKGNYFYSVISVNQTNAYWYLYLYLGLMILLPPLRCFCKGAQMIDFAVLAGIFLITQSIHPLLVHYLNFPSLQYVFSGMFPYMAAWIIVFILGFFFDATLKKLSFTHDKYIIKIIVLIILWFTGNMIPTIITTYELCCLQATTLFMDNPFWIWSFIATLSIDLLLLYIAYLTKNCKKLNSVIAYISSLTFGIYLFGDKLIQVMSPYFSISHNAVLNTLLLDLSVFIVGGVITAVLKQLPLIKKLL